MIRNGIPGILLIPLLLWGQSPLTLPEAWQIALRNNLTLQQQQDALAQAHREWQIQRSQYLPTFSINAAYSHVSEVARLEIPLPLPGLEPIEAGVKDQYDLSIGVTQPVFTGFRIRNLVRAAREQRQAAEIQAAVVKHQLLLQVGQLYYEIQQNLLQQAVLEQAIQRAEAHRQRVRNFFLAEQAAAFDTLEAANRKLQLISQLRQLQNLHRVLVTRFRHLLNTDAPLTIERMVVDTVETALPPLESYLERAIQKRPELQQVAAVRRAQLFRGKALRSAYFPQIYARAAYHYARPGVDFFRKQWMDYYTVGVSLQWEIWNWKRDRRRVEQAELEYHRLGLQEQQLVQQVRRQVTEAYQLLQTAGEQIRLQRRLVQQERERYRITRERYNQGQATPLDVSTAEKALTGAELLLQQHYIQWFQQKLQLAYAVGEIGAMP